MKQGTACAWLILISLTFAPGARVEAGPGQTIDVTEPLPVAILPFQPLPPGEMMEIEVRNQDAEPFNGELVVTPTNATYFEWPCASELEMTLTGEFLDQEPGRWTAGILVAAGDSRKIVFRWRPLARAYAEPASCSVPVNFSLFDGSGQKVAEQLGVPVTVEILPDTALSIAGTSGTISADRTFAFIDFGDLETGERAHIVFGAQANSEVQFTIESENGGALASLENADHRIGYSATFDGEDLALETGQTISRRPDRTLTGSRYRLDVEIGDVAGAFSGTYRDNITVEMVAQ